MNILNKYTQFSEDEQGTLLAIVALTLGAAVRLLPARLADFPINDGGLFYTMTRAIQEAGFRFPIFVHYNGLEIPFAYPPLAFYLTAGLDKFLPGTLLDLFRWLPGIILIATIPIFYALAKQIFKSPIQAGIAAIIFSLSPRAIKWMVMGGGLTRSLGQVFSLATLLFTYRLFKSRQKMNLIWIIFFGALTVLSHPEAAVHTALIAAVFWVFTGRDKNNFLRSLIVGVGVIIATSFWWIPVLRLHGLHPFLSAVRTGSLSPYSYFLFLYLNFSEEPFMTIIMVFAVIGVALHVFKRDYLIPVWWILPFAIEPRSASNVAPIATALLASTALWQVILPGLTKFDSRSLPNAFGSPPIGRSALGFMVFISLYMLEGVFFYGTQLATSTISPTSIEAFNWIETHTPAESPLLILSPESDPFWDAESEWFPALTKHISATTVQGLEWIDADAFNAQIDAFQDIHRCLETTPTPNCIEAIARDRNMAYDYIYISNYNHKPASALNVNIVDKMIYELNTSGEYGLVYQNSKVAVFQSQH